MGAILKVKIPFFRRKTAGTGDGFATFYLGAEPNYLPTLNQTVLITHTNVPAGSGLLNKLTNVSSNTIPALFQSFQQNVDPTAMAQTDGYANFFVLKYIDNSFSTSQFAGDCTGFIEYDINPTTYSVLKPIETAVIVNDVVPFDLSQGYNALYGSRAAFTGSTEKMMPVFCVDKRSTSSIFANALKSLNIPISTDEALKYSRTALGYYTTPSGTQVATVKVDGIPYYWNPLVTATLPGGVTTALTHPVTGVTGEYYKTVLQTIGSTQFVADLNQLPVPNNMFLIFEIPSKTYGEIIDGKSIKVTLPWWSGQTHTSPINKYLGIPHHYKASPPSNIELYGTYNRSGLNVYNLDNTLSEKDMSLQDLGARPDLSLPISNYESNVVLLFSDTIAKPYEALTGSWSSGHNNVINGVSVFNPTAREKNLYDYINDTCVGVAFLDKGFVVITHPTLVDSFFVNAVGGKLGTGGTLANPVKTYDYYGNIAQSTAISRKLTASGAGIKIYTGATSSSLIYTRNSTGKIEWENSEYLYTGHTGASVPASPFIEYLSYNTEKSLNIVCLASSDEFFKSTNDTAKQLLSVDDSVDYASFKSSSENLYPLQITQLGIHDADGNLLAVCKPTQPIPKDWYDVVSFNVRIRL